MKNLISLAAFFLLIIFYSCGSKEENSFGYASYKSAEPAADGDGAADYKADVKFSPPLEMSMGPEDASDAAAPAEDNGTTPIKTNSVDKKKIIKDGNLGVKVDDIVAAKKNMDTLVKKLGAYYENEQFNNGYVGNYSSGATISYNLKIRLPAGNFEKFLTQVEAGMGQITTRNIQARDVTEEFIDLETRLTNKRNYLKRYNELLAKASNVKDILAIEENIRILLEEIESKEGRLKSVDDQVSYSTFDIYLFKETEFVYQPGKQDKFGERVKNSLHTGWTNIVNSVLWGISHWPAIILTIVAIFFLRRYYKRRKNKKQD